MNGERLFRPNSWLRLVTVVLAVALSQFLAGCEKKNITTGTDRLEEVVVAQFGDLLLYMPLYIAVDDSICYRHGLDVSVISTGGDDKTFAAVLAGDAAFGVADPTFVAMAWEQGKHDGVVVGQLIDGVPNYGVSLSQDIAAIENLHQLQGVVIASVPAPSTSYSLTAQLFEQAGIEPHILQVGAAGLVAALEHGSADISVLIEPWVSTLERSGGAVVLSFPDFFDEFALTGITTTAAFSREKGDTVNAFLLSLREAVAVFYEDDIRTLEVARGRFANEDPRDLERGLKRMREDRVFVTSLEIGEASWKAAIDLRRSSGDILTDSDFRSCLLDIEQQ